MGNFDRNVWCLLGLPIDAVNLKQVIGSVNQSAADRSPLFISTPNLNFLVAGGRDADFRNSVIDSDMCVADGAPLIWVARILGLPVPQRVPGAGLVDCLRRAESLPATQIKVFFFGGEEGVAEEACRVINRENRGLSCSGFFYPGFGGVSEMSSPAIIELVNRCDADFVIVALGAKKGQQWILRNRDALSAPVISHLGAVVNFVAGKVKRAPGWVHGVGLEWVWRIFQEPSLWKRYWFDGLGFLKLLLTRVIPYATWQLLNRWRYSCANPVSLKPHDAPDLLTLKIQGHCLHGNIDSVRAAFRDCSKMRKPIRLELDEVALVDGAFIGLCMLLWNHQRKIGRPFSIVGLSRVPRRIFHWNCAGFII